MWIYSTKYYTLCLLIGSLLSSASDEEFTHIFTCFHVSWLQAVVTNLPFFLSQNRIKNLKQEQQTVEDQMALAGDELQKAKDLGKMLTDSKTVKNPKLCSSAVRVHNVICSEHEPFNPL